jgi:phosphate transport system substrate-binding protein
MMRGRRRAVFTRTIGAVVALALATAATADADPTGPLRGTLVSVGSDTLGGLMTRWAIAFRERHPDVRVQVQTPGSAAAPLALAEGAAEFGPMSRPMTATELSAFAQRRGHAPLQLTIALDAIAIVVHPDNPLPSLSLRQLDAVFSTTHRCGTRDANAANAAPSEPITRWTELEPDAPFATRRLLRVGRNTASGTFELFRETALCGGRYRPDVVQFPGAGAIIAAVAAHPHAIGYVGVGSINATVRAVPIRRDDTSPAVAPTAAEIVRQRYPLTRSLYLYINRPSDRPLQALPAAFLRFILSADGQALVHQEGFVPLTDTELAAERHAFE